MTTSDQPQQPPRNPNGIATPRPVAAPARMEEAKGQAQTGLPIRIFYPFENSAEGVVAHFEYSPEDETWSVIGDVSRGAHGLIISRLEIWPAATSTGVTGSLVRKIPTGELLASVRSWAAEEAAKKEGTRALLGEEAVVGVLQERDEAPARRGGRIQLTDALLRRVAQEYLKETAPDALPGAMKRMADKFGRPEETLRTWVGRARKEGWLGPSAKGRAGAEPGHKLILWLGEQMNSDEMLTKDFRARATAKGAENPEGAATIALRAYRSFGLSEFPRRTGIAPTDVFIDAAILYGRTADEELAARIQAGQDEEEASDQIAADLHEFEAQTGQ